MESTKFEVGDTVWCLIYGKGIVVGIREDEPRHPVCVDFPDIGLRNAAYTVDGKYHYKGKRTLFFSEPKVVALTVRPFVSKLLNSYVMCVTIDGTQAIGLVTEDDEYSFTLLYGCIIQRLEKPAMKFIKKITIEPTNYV